MEYISYLPENVVKYKGYEIFKVWDSFWRRYTWSVGNVQADGRMFVHQSGYRTLKEAKIGADGHFGRL